MITRQMVTCIKKKKSKLIKMIFFFRWSHTGRLGFSQGFHCYSLYPTGGVNSQLTHIHYY